MVKLVDRINERTGLELQEMKDDSDMKSYVVRRNGSAGNIGTITGDGHVFAFVPSSGRHYEAHVLERVVTAMRLLEGHLS